MSLILKKSDRELVSIWEEKIKEIFVGSIPTHSSWIGIPRIASTLRALAGTSAIHVFLPGSSGQDLGWVGTDGDIGAIEFVPEIIRGGQRPRTRVYVVNPLKLEFFVPNNNILEAHFVLTTDSIKPTGLDALQSAGAAEEVLNLGGGEYVERFYYDRGRLPDGSTIPDQARIEIRYLRPARFTIFSKASAYNRLHVPDINAYSGIHEDVDAFAALVERLSIVQRHWEE